MCKTKEMKPLPVLLAFVTCCTNLTFLSEHVLRPYHKCADIQDLLSLSPNTIKLMKFIIKKWITFIYVSSIWNSTSWHQFHFLAVMLVELSEIAMDFQANTIYNLCRLCDRQSCMQSRAQSRKFVPRGRCLIIIFPYLIHRDSNLSLIRAKRPWMWIEMDFANDLFGLLRDRLHGKFAANHFGRQTGILSYHYLRH